MSTLNIQELKKAIVKAGFEVYRVKNNEVHLAERPRDNLIMDANISLFQGTPFRVRFVVWVQKADFPGDTDNALFERASSLGASMVVRGYSEVERRTRPIQDPGDPTHLLDTWYEILFERSLPDLSESLAEFPILLKLDKTVSR